MPLISSAAEEVAKNAPLLGNEWQLRSSVQNQNVVPACKHCGLTIPAARISPDQTSSFCCAGCETVYQVLHSAGLEEYYAFRTRIGEEGHPVSEHVFDSMHEFDSESFRELYCTELSGGRYSTSLLLEGVHCAACVWLVEKVGRLESSVLDARLDIEKAKLEISWDPRFGSLSSIARRLGQMGYRPRPFSGRDAEEMRVRELRSLVIKMGVAGATAGNVMLMAFALYSGAIGFEESHTMDRVTRRFFEVASLIVSLPALWAAAPFFRGAWAALRLRTPHMDLPIALGIGGGFIWGAYGSLTGRAELYFDTITTLIFFLLVGRYIQRRHHMKARDAAELLYSILPATAVFLPELDAAKNVETRQVVARDSIVKGDYVWVESGGVLPLDGRVVRGSSSLDKSLLSGESRPVSVNEGDEVEAGALNLGQPLVIEAMRAGAETRVAQLMQQVEHAFLERTPLTTQVDRLAGIFTISVIALAVFVAVFWWQSSPERALAHALSLLIVACPCALGLATPLALSSAVKKAAREKKLIFSGIALEQLGRPGILVLDKTGTLTQGRMKVLSYEGDSSLLPLVAEMERDARHPVARTLVEYCETNGPAPADGWRGLHPTEHLGQGLSAQYEGQEILIGSQAFVLRPGYENDFARDDSAPQKSATPLYVSRGGHVCGRFWVGDQARPDAACSLLALKKQGYRLHLLSGDHPRTTRDMAEELALASGDAQLFEAVVGGVLPEQKLAYVQELKNNTQIEQKSGVFSSFKSSGPVIVMVGDGINDAGALALADVGIAVHGAAEASRMSAQVYLANAGVAELLELIQGSKRTFNTIRRGIVFSLVYNALGISLAALGILSPLIAAVLMPFSSLTVITNAYKSRSFYQPRKVS